MYFACCRPCASVHKSTKLELLAVTLYESQSVVKFDGLWKEHEHYVVNQKG